MLTVSEAIAEILAHAQPLPGVCAPLNEALGQVTTEPVAADLDSPPFDKALMDGYALRSADLPEGRGRLQVVEEVAAGRVPQQSVRAGQATRIMTGAPIPIGADAVVPIEHTRIVSSEGPVEVEIETGPVVAGRNLLRKGASTRAGDVVLPAGRILRPQELGCLAEMGKEAISVHRRPRAAVLATGDELVPIGRRPGPGQIRNSNETMLLAQLRRLGAEPIPLGIARDDSDELRNHIQEGLQHDVLLLSGGVSAGKLDLVPSVLNELGARQVFHKVRIKPGQPLWFGIYDRDAGPVDHPSGTALSRRCQVFGLPGNPVSSMVCCELFVRAAVQRMLGIEPPGPVPVRARLASEHFNGGNRPTYHPARLEWTEEGAMVRTVPWIGSADLSATVAANAMALFPEGERKYDAGTVLDVYPW